jgi:hypothetical protein
MYGLESELQGGKGKSWEVNGLFAGLIHRPVPGIAVCNYKIPRRNPVKYKASVFVDHLCVDCFDVSAEKSNVGDK